MHNVLFTWDYIQPFFLPAFENLGSPLEVALTGLDVALFEAWLSLPRCLLDRLGGRGTLVMSWGSRRRHL